MVDDALTIVERLEHRAGKDATGQVGDGVGVLLQMPHRLYSSFGLPIGKKGDYGVGMFFFPQDSLQRRQAQKLFEVICGGSLPGLAGGAGKPGGSGPAGQGLYARHLYVLCGPAGGGPAGSEL